MDKKHFIVLGIIAVLSVALIVWYIQAYKAVQNVSDSMARFTTFQGQATNSIVGQAQVISQIVSYLNSTIKK